MKRLLLILTLVCFVISGWAEQITLEQALRKAQQFLSKKGLPSSVKVAETQMSRRRAQGISQPDYYYVFNNGQNQGFVIISGDDRAETVLGYATLVMTAQRLCWDMPHLVALMSITFQVIWLHGCKATPTRLSIFRTITFSLDRILSEGLFLRFLVLLLRSGIKMNLII